MVTPDVIGLLAGALVLATFATSNMRRLRVLAILSNLAFLAYAAWLTLWPVLILHGLLLPVNAFMLWQSCRTRQSGRACELIKLPAPPRHFRPPASAAPRFQPTRNSQPE